MDTWKSWRKNGSGAMEKRVTIYDSTLRDGQQAAGLQPRSWWGKVKAAEQLDWLGVDVIEAGFPATSPLEREIVAEISGLGLTARVSGLARSVTSDIDACVESGVDVVHAFISTSDIQIRESMHSDRGTVLEKAVEAVEYVKSRGVGCIFSPMDATRTESGFLADICKEVENAGADAINLPDTVGIATPEKMRAMVSQVCMCVHIPVQVHCHNDYGLAAANSVAAVQAGASCVQVTMNGIGERAGNAALEQVVMQLQDLYGFKTGIHIERLAESARAVADAMGHSISCGAPIVGSSAFTHQSGIHGNAAAGFEPFPPERVGAKRAYEIGRNSGSGMIAHIFHKYGYEIGKTDLANVAEMAKEFSEQNRIVISEKDFIERVVAPKFGTPKNGERITVRT